MRHIRRKTSHRRPLVRVAVAALAFLAAFGGQSLGATAAPVAAAATGTASDVPSPDVLNVDFAGGTPNEHAQNLPVKTWGAPSITKDATLGTDVARFDGSTSAYSYPMSGQWGKLSNGFTMSCVMRADVAALPGGSPGAQGFGSCGDTYAGGAIIEVTAGQVSFALMVNGVYQFVMAPIKPSSWYDVVGTWDGQNANVYVDGALAQSIHLAGSLTAPQADAQNWVIGAGANNNNGLRGYGTTSVASTAIWSSALTAAQVQSLAAASHVPAETVAAPDILNADFSDGTPTDSAQNLPVKVNGAPVIANDAAVGKNVATFDGAHDAYEYSFANQWNKLTSGITVECRFKWNGATIPTTGQSAICSNAQSGGADMQIDSGQLAFSIDVNGYQYTHVPIKPGVWYDAVATWDGQWNRLYLDGRLAATTPASGNITAPSAGAQNFTVGADSAGGGGFETPSPVSVDTARVWSSALTPGQVNLLHEKTGVLGGAPAAGILDMNVTDGAPTDYAQGLPATVKGSPAIANDATFGHDVVSFNGGTDAYLYPFSAQWNKMKTGLTVECVFKWNGASIPTAGQSAICSNAQSGGADLQIDSGQLAFSVNTGGAYHYTHTPIVPGVWYDAVATWDGANTNLYVNGQLKSTVAAGGALGIPAAGAQNFTIGADSAVNGGFETPSPVSIEAARVWATALSAGQVGAQASNPVAVTASGHGTASASPATARPGQTVTLTATPDTGYHLTGWKVTQPANGSVTVGTDGTFTMPSGAVAVQASIAPDTYTVHYDAGGGSGQLADSAFTYDQAGALSANTFTRAGYTFAGWATTAGGAPMYADAASVSNLSATDGGSVTLYAAWLPDGAHRLTVSSGAHGTASSANGWWAQTGSTVTLTTTPDTGYHFDAWKVMAPGDGSLSIPATAASFTMPNADVTVAAQFAANHYTVHFDANGADGGSTADEALTFGTPAQLTVNGFGRDGYAFTGWSTSAGGTVAYADMATVNDLSSKDGDTVTLYAQWRQLSITAGSWSSLPEGFVTGTFKLPGVPVAGAISQPLLGLWNGAAPATFTKASGDSWLTVRADGTVTGTAPQVVPQNAGEITVTATQGGHTSRILVEVPVLAQHASPQVRTASWNAWSDGAKVTDAVGKNLAVVASEGIGVIGFQDGGNAMAQDVAAALGWNAHGAGDLGIVSAYPFTSDKKVDPSDSLPAAAATLSVDGDPLRVWDTHLDEADYAPENACFNGVTDASALVSAEQGTTRYAQAKAVAAAMKGDLSSSTPVVLLGDLASPSASDWTAATAAAHCGVGAVDWPVPGVFASAGLLDSYRTANMDPSAAPGITWSPIVTTNANGKPEPQDRVDYVDYTTAGGMNLVKSDTLTVGWPSASNPAGNSWASDHAAVETVFALHGDSTGATGQPVPTVSVAHDTIAYQVGSDAPSAASFLGDVAAAAAPSGGSALSADLSGVDFTKAGWYTVLVTASRKGMTSAPVAVTVRVAPVPTLTLGNSTATFTAGDAIDQASVLAQLEPALDVSGGVTVDLSPLGTPTGNKGIVAAPGSYKVTVTATDVWGFTTAAGATVQVNAAGATPSATPSATPAP